MDTMKVFASAESIMRRNHVATAYGDSEFMEQAGIEEKIELLLEEAGWSELPDIHYNTHVGIVSQFLATVRAGLLKDGTPGIMFKIDGAHYQLSDHDVRRSLGMSQTWSYFRISTDDITSMWEDIAETRREDRQYRQELQLIKKPEYFYLYKMLVEGPFGRPVSHKGHEIHLHELHILTYVWLGLKPDWVQLLVDHWERVRRNQDWDVSCGGIITRLLYDQGITRESFVRDKPIFPRYIDEEELLSYGEIYVDHTGKVYWMYEEEEEDYDMMLGGPRREQFPDPCESEEMSWTDSFKVVQSGTLQKVYSVSEGTILEEEPPAKRPRVNPPEAETQGSTYLGRVLNLVQEGVQKLAGWGRRIPKSLKP